MYYIGDCIVEGYIMIGQTEFKVFENSYTIGYNHVLIIMDNTRRLYYDKYIVMYHICEHKEHTHILELFNDYLMVDL